MNIAFNHVKQSEKNRGRIEVSINNRYFGYITNTNDYGKHNYYFFEKVGKSVFGADTLKSMLLMIIDKYYE